MGASHHESQKSKFLSRRKFLKQSAMGTLGLSLAGKFVPGFASSLFLSDIKAKSRVVLVRHSKVIDSSGKIQQPILQEMLDKAMTTFTGKNTIADSWLEFVSPEDVIGLKINTLGLRNVRGTEFVTHYSCLTSAILTGFRKAGIHEKNVVIWDRSDEELVNAGFATNEDPGAIRVIGARGIGYTKQSFPVGNRTSHVSRILMDTCTALVNIPLLKTHRLAGVTGALKNHYGSIDNPREFHANGCTHPGIPEVNAIPAIRKKQRLIIGDALLGVYEGGPRWRREFIWPYGGILVGTDPVAVDSILMKILDEKRTSAGMPRMESRAQHVKLAEKLGLGTCDSDKIDFVEMELG